jgi:hypothetical protein
MKHLLLAIFVAGVLAGAPAPAADTSAENNWVTAKRQLLGCMSKRMSASRTVSYNEAKKTCTAQLKPPPDTAPHLTAAR